MTGSNRGPPHTEGEGEQNPSLLSAVATLNSPEPHVFGKETTVNTSPILLCSITKDAYAFGHSRKRPTPDVPHDSHQTC